jgi:hypothetical protein
MIVIDRMKPGLPPEDFTFARTGRGGEGKWSVVEDPTASTGRATEQSSTDRTDYRFPLAIHDSLSVAKWTPNCGSKRSAARSTRPAASQAITEHSEPGILGYYRNQREAQRPVEATGE